MVRSDFWILSRPRPLGVKGKGTLSKTSIKPLTTAFLAEDKELLRSLLTKKLYYPLQGL
jgi:hypothetical protein